MPAHRISRWFPLIFVVADLTVLNIGVFVANHLRFGTWWYQDESYLLLQGILNGAWVLTFIINRLHEINREDRLIDHVNRTLAALVVHLAFIFAFWFVAKPYYYSRHHLFLIYLIFSGGVVLWRMVWHYVIRYYRAKGYNVRNVAIVGYGDLARDLEEHIQTTPELGYRLVGYFDKEPSVGSNYLGTFKDLKRYHKKEPIDVIFCFLPRLQEEETKKLIDFAENHLIRVKIISQFSKLVNKNLTLQRYGGIPIINVSAIPLDSPANQFVKRVFDVVFASLVMLFIFSWLFPVIALLIKMESKGPVFFKQYRHGLNNRPFLCWKFRTMVVNKESDSKQATKNDPRITKVGAVLRKTSIDELPQFINVFLGDMSVVGPRPHPLKLNEEFQGKIDRFIQRHAVKPGITGLAQAKGFRGETAEFSDMSGRVRLDRFYVKNWSLILDFKIIVLTVISIVKGSENAY